MMITRTIKRIIFWILGILLFLLISLFGVIWIYSDEMQNKVIEAINDRLITPITIQKVKFSPFDHFPNITLKLDQISLNKTVPSEKKLFELEQLQVVFDLTQLIQGKYKVQNVVLHNGYIDIVTDSLGGKDFDIIKHDTLQKDTTKKSAKFKIELDNIHFHDFSFRMQNVRKKQHIALTLEKVHAKAVADTSIISGNINGSIFSEQITLRPGTLLEATPLHLKLNWDFNKETKQIRFISSTLDIAKDIYHITGGIDLTDNKMLTLDIQSTKVNLVRTMRLLPRKIAKKVDSLESEGNFLLHGLIKTSLIAGHQPYVNVTCAAQNVTIRRVHTPFELSKVNFNGSFVYDTDDTTKPKIEHLTLQNFEGIIANEKIKADFILTDFKKPHLHFNINSNIDFKQLELALDDKRFESMTGKAKLDLVYKGSLAHLTGKEINPMPFIRGAVIFDNVNIKLKKMHFPLNNIKGMISIKDSVSKIENLSLSTGNSKITLNGNSPRIISAILIDDVPIRINAKISSDLIDMRDFLGDTHMQKTGKQPKKKSSKKNTTVTANSFLPANTIINLRGDISKVQYRKFLAQNVKLNVSIKDQILNYTQQAQALSGNLNFKINVDARNPKASKFNMQAEMKQLDVSKLFYSFEDFNQHVLTSKQLTGYLNANIYMNYNFDSSLNIDTSSINTVIAFDLNQCSLTDFEPITKMSTFIFKKRDFEHLKLERMSNTLTVTGTTLRVPKMAIISNILYCYMEGQYNFTTKNMQAYLQVPLRNLKKNFKPEDTSNTATKKGLNINVAVEGTPGKLKARLGHKSN